MASAFRLAARRGGLILIVTGFVSLGIPGISFAQQGTPQQGTPQQGTPVPPGETERRIEQQRTLNEALEQRIRNLEEELASDVCAALDQQGTEACLEPSPLIDFSRPAVNPDSGERPGTQEKSSSPAPTLIRCGDVHHVRQPHALRSPGPSPCLRLNTISTHQSGKNAP